MREENPMSISHTVGVSLLILLTPGALGPWGAFRYRPFLNRV
jgi:hypothetical protein